MFDFAKNMIIFWALLNNTKFQKVKTAATSVGRFLLSIYQTFFHYYYEDYEIKHADTGYFRALSVSLMEH